ncbi:hypothetical protein Bbelb_197870 [Branchiostoma belcheri]|nr:hypothetical protein Bbelb_197870 [Branchiostoma belcheri]
MASCWCQSQHFIEIRFKRATTLRAKTAYAWEDRSGHPSAHLFNPGDPDHVITVDPQGSSDQQAGISYLQPPRATNRVQGVGSPECDGRVGAIYVAWTTADSRSPALKGGLS